MGAIKTKELSNGNIGLEITYGGTESPFGGVDTSAPPAYIDPKCFTDSEGFVIVDNALVVASLQPTPIPATIWGGVTDVYLLKFGTFYNSIYGQLNYILGYKTSQFSGPPSGVNYVFYMTAWPAGDTTTVYNDTLEFTLFDALTVQSQASLTLDCINSNNNTVAGATGTGAIFIINSIGGPGVGPILTASFTGGTGYTIGTFFSITQYGGIYAEGTGAVIEVTAVSGSGAVTGITLVNGGNYYQTGGGWDSTLYNDLQQVVNATVSLSIVGPSGTNTYTIPSIGSGSAFSRVGIVGAMVTAINAGPDPNVIAQSSVDGYSIILNAITAGIAGNAITAQDFSANIPSTLAPVFYFSCRTARNLEGGQINAASAAPTTFVVPSSTTDVGGTLYIANLGPMILKYSGPGAFTTSTLYNGVGVIKKFGGSLIGLRLTGQLGTLTQNQDMIFAWTAAEILDEWAPVSVNGNVTGAGFAQLADIGDYLTGLIVTNATAFIIRSQGLSYATATGNATSPFNFNHIGLGETGEGSQNTNLVCQYDQTGVFVGNSDVYQISGSISSIGSKIKALLFDVFLNETTFVFGQLESSNACSIAIGGDVIPVVMICLGGIPTGSTSSIVLFNFNMSNGTWMLFTYPALLNSAITRPQLLCSMLGTFKTISNNTNLNGYIQNAMVTGIQLGSASIIGQPPVPVLPVFYSLEEGLANGLSVSNPAFIEFPVEEITFGRDVTMDSIYIALVADLSEDMIVNFSFNGVDFSSVTLEAANFTSLEDNPTEIQLFPSTEVFTAHSPQLRIDIPSLTDEGTAKIRFTKIMSLGSFDPNQRPT